jgi:hypothetical protein
MRRDGSVTGVAIESCDDVSLNVGVPELGSITKTTRQEENDEQLFWRLIWTMGHSDLDWDDGVPSCHESGWFGVAEGGLPGG